MIVILSNLKIHGQGAKWRASLADLMQSILHNFYNRSTLQWQAGLYISQYYSLGSEAVALQDIIIFSKMLHIVAYTNEVVNICRSPEKAF